jgi:hypothetical protein
MHHGLYDAVIREEVSFGGLNALWIHIPPTIQISVLVDGDLGYSASVIPRVNSKTVKVALKIYKTGNTPKRSFELPVFESLTKKCL